MSAITVGDDLVHYEVLGRGRTVILLHGWLGSWRYWIPTMRFLQLRYRVYAVDLFGYGDSAKNPDRYPINQQVEMLYKLVDKLELPKVAMIGHGLGAMVMAHFARKYPQQVARMMFVSAPLFDPGDLDERVPIGQQVLLTPDSPQVEQGGRSRHGQPLARKVNDNDDRTVASAGNPQARRPVMPSDPTIQSASNQTLGPNMIDRERLREMAMSVGDAAMRGDDVLHDEEPPRATSVSKDYTTPPTPGTDTDNPLFDILKTGPDSLLARCFKRPSEPGYDAVAGDVGRMDSKVLTYSASGYDAGNMLDLLRLLDIPMVITHGRNDPLIEAPKENIWEYLTDGNDTPILPVPLDNVKHFPMLEQETFMRLLSSFLETPNINNIEIKERWRRRTR